MKTWIFRAALGVAALVVTVVPIKYSPDNGLGVACAYGSGCKPQWMWVCFGEEDYEDRCPLTDDYCEAADPTFPPAPE
ncbi:MAG: hypothetical protein OXG58_06180 [Gemmatimonadetes bacterium]|nr:hypothetical protein [Gemmatimonadota bacterium]